MQCVTPLLEAIEWPSHSSTSGCVHGSSAENEAKWHPKAHLSRRKHVVAKKLVHVNIVAKPVTFVTHTQCMRTPSLRDLSRRGALWSDRLMERLRNLDGFGRAAQGSTIRKNTHNFDLNTQNTHADLNTPTIHIRNTQGACILADTHEYTRPQSKYAEYTCKLEYTSNTQRKTCTLIKQPF